MSAVPATRLPGRGRVPRCRVNVYGDLICPACGAQLIRPGRCVVVAGVGECSICRASFRVTRRAAGRSNERAGCFEARMAMEALTHESRA